VRGPGCLKQISGGHRRRRLGSPIEQNTQVNLPETPLRRVAPVEDPREHASLLKAAIPSSDLVLIENK
jgi:hypothetical protein